MTKRIFAAVAVLTCLVAVAHAGEKKAPAVLNFTMQTLDGKKVDLADRYAGKVVMFVNVASQCGNTPQYAGLQELHDKYSKDGLAIVGVPCNQFGQQEPGSAKEIAAFCEKNYGVTFDMLSKVDVNGTTACPLYKHLTSKETNPKHAGKVKWNFEKFLVGKNGEIVARFAPGKKPESEEIVSTIEKELKK